MVLKRSIIITLFATSAAKRKEKKEEKTHTNIQAITTKQLNENAQNTLSELQRPVIRHIATLQPVTNTDRILSHA